MKQISVILISVLSILLICCGASKTIALKSQSDRSDVFREVTTTEALPAGYADVIIRADIKTHLKGYYIGESAESAHGKASYPYLVNIDGQAVLWKAEGIKHVLPEYENCKTSLDPEAGTGMKYSLEKEVKLAAGTHTVFLGLPEEPYYTVTEITVNSGGYYVLTFRPEYRYKRLPTRIPSFLQGISRYEALLSESER